MTALLLLVVCLFLGMGVARFARPPPTLSSCLNWWLMNIALPALVLDLIPHVHFDAQLWFLPVSSLLVFLGGWGVFALLAPRTGWSRARTGAVVLTAGLGNTSFMGFPMIEALRGHDAMALAVIVDQTGSFIALAVGGVLVTSVYTGQPVRLGQVGLRVLRFPPFAAMLVGVAAAAAGGWPELLHGVFERIGTTLVPIALFSVGLQFRLTIDRSRLSAMACALGWKMALAPAACLGLGLLTGVHGLVLVVGVLQAAAAPMVSAAILAEQAQLEPELASMTLGAGVLIALVTVPLWNFMF